VDIDSFSDVVSEVVKEVETYAAAAETVDPQPIGRQDEATPEFMKELDMTVHKGEDPALDAPIVQTRENLPKDQDPTPSVIAFNKSVGTSYWGELLSLGYEKIDARDGSSKLITLWTSPKIVCKIGGHSEQRSPPLLGTPEDLRSTSSAPAPPSRVIVEMLSRKGS
jgi:hypothetical protein